MTRVLLLCGALAGPLFVAVFLIEGATRPGYDPVTMPVSALALSDAGWMQVMNFVITGLLLIVGGAGLRRVARQHSTGSTAGAWLIAIVGLGLIAAGLFVTDPGLGYPPGIPPPAEPSISGVVHDLVSFLLFLLFLPLSCFAFALRFARQGAPGWAAYSALSGVLSIAGFVVLIVAFSTTGPLHEMLGVIQRATVAGWFGWVTMVAIHALRTRRSMAPQAVPLSS